jgi:transcriptional regulator with XRE-family HTH domain
LRSAAPPSSFFADVGGERVELCLREQLRLVRMRGVRNRAHEQVQPVVRVPGAELSVAAAGCGAHAANIASLRGGNRVTHIRIGFDPTVPFDVQPSIATQVKRGQRLHWFPVSVSRVPARPNENPQTKIAFMRVEAGITQQEMSELTGIPIATCKRLESGRMSNPPIRYITNCWLVLDAAARAGRTPYNHVPWDMVLNNDWDEWFPFDPENAAEPPDVTRFHCDA